MKTLTFLLLLLLSCVATSQAFEDPGEPRLLDFIASEHDRQYTSVPHEVLAFYYTWYGRPDRPGQWIHWGGEDKTAHDIPESRHYPARGAYDSQDPALIAAHITGAKALGLTGFISTWWGQGSYEDHTFKLLLDQAETNNFKTTIYWETAPGKGREQISRAVSDLVYVLKNYGSSRAFLKVDGKPVIFVYGRVMGEVPLASWPAIITQTRAQAGDFLLIADGYNENFARMFDGLHTYNNCAQVQGKSPTELRAWSRESYASAVQLARQQGRISCVTVIPGYDDTKIRKPGLAVDRQDGEVYRVLWREAIRAQPDWVLITSFNEWHEGSEIEPSREDGDKYLKLTAEYAPLFLAEKPIHASVAAKPAISADQLRQLRGLFHGRTIGVLPEFGGTAYWLLDAGLPVKELSWAEVADPAVLSLKNFPVLLQAGGEYYSSTGKVAGDVLPALQRYLASGGFLLSMPDQQPFPFYYDSTTGKPQVIANQIGLPVRQGWEKPPADAQLEFHFNTNTVPGLPLTAPFPTDGDLRWRPAVRAAVGRDDLYVPIASLFDSNGRSFGDGIAYVELRSPPLTGGRTLYVWMRMDDVGGKDKLLPAIFKFVGEKLAGPQ